MSKLVVISSSLRIQSTSRALLDKVLEGVKDHHEVETIDLRELNYGFCKGCMACQQLGKCVQNDDINKVMDVVSNADILLFVTPIYYYSISGQLKTFLDRLNALYTKDNKFKKVYSLFTCADDNPKADEGPKKAIQGWVDCFDGVSYVDNFTGFGLDKTSDITGVILDKAYKFGQLIK